MALDGDLHKLASLTELPVGAVEAASALDVAVGEVLDAGRTLTESGRLREEGSGWVAVETAEMSGPERAVLAGQLAAAIDPSDPGRKGRLLAIAGSTAEALPLLVEAGSGGDPKAAEAALEIGPADPTEAGRLHLGLAGHHRSRGETQVAIDHARRSLPLLEGVATIDALGFIAQLHDDLQEPQAAATWANLAAGAALNNGDEAKAGSLLTFAGRAMSRLGFAEEAGNASDTGLAMVESHGTPAQKARARDNRAWVHLDHGNAEQAAIAFDSISDLTEYIAGDAGEASRLANAARALFQAGQSSKAIDYYEESIRLAGDAPAPNFLAHLGFAEGATLHSMGESAVDAAEKAVAITESDMPSWRNVAYLTLARAERSAGMHTEAAGHLQQAASLTPEGIDGLRLRLRCEVERLAQLDEKARWPKDEAATLTDLLLQSRWYAMAVELMSLRAKHEKGSDLGAQAVALAARIGNPLLAARAAGTADLWGKPEGAAAATLIREADEGVADPWRGTWDALPEVKAALAVPTAASVAGVDDRLEQSLTKAGLTGETLSPAQRSAQGLEYSGQRTARSWIGPILGAAAVVVAIVALLIVMQEPEVTATPTTQGPVASTTTLPIVAPPDQWVGGFHPNRGGSEGTGVSDGGVEEVAGYYWEPLQPGGDTLSATLADGVRLFFASSTRDFVTQISQETGDESWELPVPGSIKIPLTVAPVELEVGRTLYIMWITEDGTIGVFSEAGDQPWTMTGDQLPGTSSAPAVTFGETAFVGRRTGSTGYLAAVALDSGNVLWRTDQEHVVEDGTTDDAGEPIDLVLPPVEMEPVTTAISVKDDIIVLAPDGQRLHYLSATTREFLCEYPQTAGQPARPVISDGYVAVPGNGGIGIYPFPECDKNALKILTWSPDLGTEVAAVGNRLFFVTEGGLIGVDHTRVDPNEIAAEKLWDIVNPSTEGDTWTTSPVITGNQVLVGSEEGEIAAFDIDTGELVWSWFIDGEIVDELTPVKGAIYATTFDGVIYALAGERLDADGATTTTQAADETTTTTEASEAGGESQTDGTTTTTEGPSADDVAGQTGTNSAGRG